MCVFLLGLGVGVGSGVGVGVGDGSDTFPSYPLSVIPVRSILPSNPPQHKLR